MNFQQFSDAVTIRLNLNDFTVGTYRKVIRDISNSYVRNLTLDEYEIIIDALIEMINGNLKDGTYTKNTKV